MTFAVWEKGKTMRLFDMDSKEDYLLDGKYKVATPYAPLVNVVEVVRCKDCKHYAFTDNRVPQERVWWCYYWGYEIGADDYCSNGERKDDE